jgi:tetratricopeptide (TPR) repeat protein
MADSKLRQIRKILEKPVPPAHIQQRQYHVIVPWYERVWDAIRPPAAVAAKRKRMNRNQRKLLWMTLGALAPIAAGWAAYDYISNAPLRARAEYQAGMSRLGPNDFAGAMEHFTKSIAIAESASAYLQRGNAYKNLGRFDQAVVDWSRSIELDPNQADAFTARGTYYQSKNDTAKALADFERSLLLNPTVDGYFQRGQVYAALKQFDKAIQDYDRAIAERRDAPWVYLARSIAKRALGDEDGYRQDQERAAQLQGQTSAR